MKKIEFNYLKDRKVTNKFKELYHNQVNIVWRLDKKFIREDDVELIFDREQSGAIEKYDMYYISLVHKDEPEKFLSIYIWWSLRSLLKKWSYKWDYDGIIRVYWEFWLINTTRTNIWKIWRVDILDNEENVIESICDDKDK